MFSFRQLPLNILTKWTLIFVLAIGSTTALLAQAATAPGLYNEALASLKAKDYEKGLPQIEAALKAAEAEGNEKVIGLAKKNGAKAAYNVGSSKRKAKAYDEALTLFERGIELNPEYSANYMGRAQALEGKGDKAEAIKAYLKAAEFAETAGKADRAAQLTKKAGNIVGKIYSSKDYAAAIEAGKAHLELKESATVHYYLAKSYEKQKDNASASTHINKAVELAGATATDKYFWAQGNILEATGNKAEAKAAYQKITGEKYKANAEYRIGELEK